MAVVHESAGKETWFGKATRHLDSFQIWVGGSSFIWAVTSGIASQSKLFGGLNWADSILVGAILAILLLLGITSSLALYRYFKPVYSQSLERRNIISGNRGLITSYFKNGQGLTFRDFAEHQAVFLFVRRFLTPEFRTAFDAAEAKTTTYFDPTVRLYMDEIDRLADLWKVA